MIRSAILCASLISILVASLPLAAAEEADAKKAAYQLMINQAAARDLSGLGGLQLTFADDHFVLESPSSVQAAYRFPGDPDMTPLPVGSSIPLPVDVNMFLVELKWLAGQGPPICEQTSQGGTGELCENTQKVDSKKKSGEKGSTSTPTAPVTTPVTVPTTQEQPPENKYPCCIVAVFARELEDGNHHLIPAFIITESNMLVSETLLIYAQDPSHPSYSINGVGLDQLVSRYEAQRRGLNPSPSAEATYAVRSGWTSVVNYHFIRYSGAHSCRPYQRDDSTDAIDARRPNYNPPDLGKDNGIIPFPPKVYDVFTLRQMLAQTASQLSALSGFNPASITSALTNLQGITSSTSFLNVQATTNPTPSIASTANNPNTSTSTVTPATGTSSTSVTATCPTGFVPTGAGSTVTCTAGTGSPSNQATITTTTTPAGNSNPSAGAQTTVTSNPLTQQTVTTNPSVTATIPTALAPTAFAAPTNIGESANDLLTDQVQLNAQITSLQLALQGALSDQFLVKEGKTIATRQQTTLGLNIDLHPVQRYRHAVAEVRVWVFPSKQSDEISVVNLLPAAKTYNVAKITSKQNQFGASVVINPINVGVSGGKAKNRLYLAKDTDTLALQYFADRDKHNPDNWPNGAERIGRSPQEHIFVDFPHRIEAWQKVKDACDSDPGPDRILVDQDHARQLANPLVFGWQFRPVLGADYVQGGIRPVFAQLALPVNLGTQYAPHVFIQTLWRAYDEKKQVVGAVFSGSCSIVEETDPIEMVSPLRVHSVYVDDMGGGVLKVSAEGQFLAQGFSVLSGQSTIGPTVFDGKRIQLFGNAASLLTTDDLKLVAEDGETTNLGMKANFDDACNISYATLHAVPRPDGNSWIEATIHSGLRFRLPEDKAPKPLFLIGSQVYGLHETPFLEPSDHACGPNLMEGGITCNYHFLASTDVLRAAESYTVRDLAWDQFKYSDRIRFAPSFSSLALLAANQPATPDNSAPPKKPAVPPPAGQAAPAPSQPAAVPPVYTLVGNDFENFMSPLDWNCDHSLANCLEVYLGLSKFHLTDDDFQVVSRTTAAITFAPAPDNGAICATPHIVGAHGTATIADGTADAEIFYTTDGETPTVGSSKSTKFYPLPGVNLPGHAIPVTATTKLKAIAVAPNHFQSTVAVAMVENSAAYHVVQIPASTGTASALSYKSYRFLWHTAHGERVEWDLPVPQVTPPTVTASSVLNESDSTEITFSNVQVLASSVAYPITFTWDGNVLTTPAPVFKYDSSAQTVKILITSNMTAKPGHKELLLNGYTMAPGTSTPTAVQIELPFDVTKR